MQTQQIVTIVLGVLALVAIGYLLYSYNTTPMIMPTMEGFAAAPAEQVQMAAGMAGAGVSTVDGSEPIELVEQPQGVAQVGPDLSQNQMLPQRRSDAQRTSPSRFKLPLGPG